LQFLATGNFKSPDNGGNWCRTQSAIANFAEQTASGQPFGDLQPTKVALEATKAAEAVIGGGQSATLMGIEQAVV
jgi:hypothetical protein